MADSMWVGVDDNKEVPFIFFTDEERKLIGAYSGSDTIKDEDDLQEIVYGGYAEVHYNVDHLPDEQRELILENYGDGEQGFGAYTPASVVFSGTDMEQFFAATDDEL